ncbi:MAG: hypothetical protein L0216_12835 [Planctomycetales bacterium]|nr:hypothetical protein [Planctomycetales bacterium]
MTRHRLACALGMAALALTLPFNAFVILLGFAVDATRISAYLGAPLVKAFEIAGEWGSAGGLACAVAAILVGRRVRARSPSDPDAPLARAGEILGSVALPIAGALLVGALLYEFGPPPPSR